VLRLVFLPFAEAHVTEENDGDKLGLWNADQVTCDRNGDSHEEAEEEFGPPGRLWIPSVAAAHQRANSEGNAEAE